MHKHLPDNLDSDCVETLISAITKRDKLTCEIVDCAYHVAGFAIGKVVPCVHPTPIGVGALSDEDKVAALKTLLPAQAVAAVDIPWLLIWAVVKQIIDKYLQGETK